VRYIEDMAPRRPPISLRLGEDGHRDLDDLARRRGITRAEAMRQALAETAARERRRSGLRAEVERLMADPDDVAESLAIAAFMEELRGPG
jgi:predicted transcriptional regulator